MLHYHKRSTATTAIMASTAITAKSTTDTTAKKPADRDAYRADPALLQSPLCGGTTALQSPPCGGTTTLQSPHHRGTRRTNRTHFKALRVEALSASKGEIDVICPAQLHDCTSILNKETSVAAQPSAHRAAIHNINRIVADPPSLRDGTSVGNFVGDDSVAPITPLGHIGSLNYASVHGVPRSDIHHLDYTCYYLHDQFNQFNHAPMVRFDQTLADAHALRSNTDIDPCYTPCQEATAKSARGSPLDRATFYTLLATTMLIPAKAAPTQQLRRRT